MTCINPENDHPLDPLENMAIIASLNTPNEKSDPFYNVDEIKNDDHGRPLVIVINTSDMLFLNSQKEQAAIKIAGEKSNEEYLAGNGWTIGINRYLEEMFTAKLYVKGNSIHKFMLIEAIVSFMEAIKKIKKEVMRMDPGDHYDRLIERFNYMKNV